jgi:hypothetical protein
VVVVPPGKDRAPTKASRAEREERPESLGGAVLGSPRSVKLLCS